MGNKISRKKQYVPGVCVNMQTEMFSHLSYLKLIHLLTANSLYYNPETTGKCQEAYRLLLYDF